MPKTLQITTPSRLHFTLIDLNAELGRVDGGIGVTLNHPGWDVTVEVSDEQPEYTDRVAEVFNNLSRFFQMKNKYNIIINQNVPRHVGLGSQTQLALGLARAVSIFEDQGDIPIRNLARYVGRGGTSGIGVAAFENGGFVLDGGHSTIKKPEFLPTHFSKAEPAVVLANYPVPENWYFIVAVPNVEHGAHGTREAAIFQEHCPLPTTEVEKVSRVILMQTLPSILENDIENFGRSLSQLQKIGFKRVENALQLEVIHNLQEFYLANGAFGAGLSSFGPATYGLVEGESDAKKLTETARKFLEEDGVGGDVFYSKGNNRGAEVNTIR
jgi:beta-ribofuranosylaminobenzene 5'-phosphate synthase